MTSLTQKEVEELRTRTGTAAIAVLPQLKNIQQLLEQANAIWQEMDSQIQDSLLEFHNEETSLAHCLRWGEQAAYELVTVVQDQ